MAAEATDAPSPSNDREGWGRLRVTLFDADGPGDRAQLWSQTKLMMIAGIGVVGVLYSMPTSFTGWDRSDSRRLPERWWENVQEGPIWDRDEWVINGEWAHQKEKQILEGGGTVWGSRKVGAVSLFLLDPVERIGNAVNHWADREVFKTGQVSFQGRSPVHHEQVLIRESLLAERYWGLSMRLYFE